MTDVRTAEVGDLAEVARIAAAAFRADPVMCWALRDDARREDQLAQVFTGLARDMVPGRGHVQMIGGGAVALWRDPTFDHAHPQPDDEDASDRSDAPLPLAPDELERFAVLRGAMHAAHPQEPHWYLNVVGTLPERQGQGLGARVLAPILARCDAEGHRAYLESSNPRNLPFYRRLGFVDAGEISLPDGPSLVPMWRDPGAHGPRGDRT